MTSERQIEVPPIPTDYTPPRRVSRDEYHRLEERAGQVRVSQRPDVSAATTACRPDDAQPAALATR